MILTSGPAFGQSFTPGSPSGTTIAVQLEYRNLFNPANTGYAQNLGSGANPRDVEVTFYGTDNAAACNGVVPSPYGTYNLVNPVTEVWKDAG